MVRRLELTVAADMGLATMDMTITIELYDLGAPITITPPPADEITDFGGCLAASGAWSAPGSAPPDGVASVVEQAGGLGHEVLGVDDHPGDPPDGDEAAVVVHRDGEGDPAPVDLLDDRLGRRPGGRRRRARGGRAGPSCRPWSGPAASSGATAASAASSHSASSAGRGQHRHLAGAQGDGRVGLADDELDRCAQAGLDGHRRYATPLDHPPASPCNDTHGVETSSVTEPGDRPPGPAPPVAANPS